MADTSAADAAATQIMERWAGMATDALKNVASAALMTWEGAPAGANGHDARRMILARMVVEHRLRSEDPLELPATDWEEDATTALLDPGAIPLDRAARLVAA